MKDPTRPPKIKYYITADLCEAAVLLALPQCMLSHCEWENEDKGIVHWVILIKPNSEFSLQELQDVLQDLDRGAHLVEPRSFMSALRRARVAMQEFAQSKNRELPGPHQVRSVINPRSREKQGEPENAGSSTV